MFSNKKLIFNGFQAEDLGFIVVEGAPEILAQEDYEVVTVEGRNGSLIINKGTYPDIEKTFTITAIDYIDDDNIEGMIDNIKKWLFNITDNRLFYTFSNKYNIVKKVIFNEDIRTSFEEFGDFQVTFLCEPFYYTEEDTIIIKKESSAADVISTFTNSGDFESSPYIRIYGNGSIGFFLNGVNIAIKNVSGSVEIDTKLLTCTSYGTNKIQDLLSDFPTLAVGKNTITIPLDQSITQIEITPRTIFR